MVSLTLAGFISSPPSGSRAFDVLLQTSQVLAPERLVFPKPCIDSPQRFGIQTAEVRRAALLSGDQPRGAQQVKVLGDGGAAGPEVARELSYGLRAAAQQTKNLSAGRIGDGPERHVRSLLFFRNHSVTNMVTIWLQDVNTARSPGRAVGYGDKGGLELGKERGRAPPKYRFVRDTPGARGVGRVMRCRGRP